MASSPPASLRPVPFPFRSMLAICSDLDETPDRDVYWECQRFLNTTDSTRMGRGLGLEVGNTIYFDMPPDQFAYWNTDDRGRAEIRALIQSGHIDCLHSFGDLATTRAHAARALEELERHGCQLRVWVDHAVAPTNFGGDIMRGQGDVPGSPAYHADLTWAFGIRHVWRGRVTSVIGQDAPHSLRGVVTIAHASASMVTAGKELSKRVLGSAGFSKYRMNADNRLQRPIRLRSGHNAVEFLRTNPSWGGVSCFDTADGLADVLTPALLRRLATRRAVAVLYTHLGKIRDPREPFGPRTRAALRALADAQADGQILVTTTRRLLDYWSLVRSANLTSTVEADGRIRLDISARDAEGREADCSALAGFTIYVDDPKRTTVRVNGGDVQTVSNPPDDCGNASLSIPWRPLEYPHP